MATARDQLARDESSYPRPNNFDSLAASTVVSPEPSINEKDTAYPDGSNAVHFQHQRSPHGASASHHVDVDQAKGDFITLQRTLTEASRSHDVESANSSEFDLRDYFTSTAHQAAEHGVKHKHLGVTWRDLSVDVIDIGSKVGGRRLA